MLRKHAFTLFALSLLVMGSVATARAGGGEAPSYPNWAAAVVPAYPNCLPSSGPVGPTLYGIGTTDSMPVVLAWYKARVKGAWTSAERGNTWSVRSGGIRIQISKNLYDDDGNEKPGTRIALLRRQ